MPMLKDDLGGMGGVWVGAVPSPDADQMHTLQTQLADAPDERGHARHVRAVLDRRSAVSVHAEVDAEPDHLVDAVLHRFHDVIVALVPIGIAHDELTIRQFSSFGR